MVSPVPVQKIDFHPVAKLAETVGLYAHVVGLSRPAHAREIAEPCIRIGGVGHVQALVALELAKAARGPRRGRRGNDVVFLMLGGPPTYTGEQGEPWPRERELEWARAAHAWVEDVYGPEAIVVESVLHRDEASPHLHVSVVPMVGGRPSEKACAHRYLARMLHPRRKAGRFYSALADCFYTEVSRRFGIARGQKGSTRRYEPISERHAAEAKGRIEERELQQRERAAALSDAAAAERERTERLLAEQRRRHDAELAAAAERQATLQRTILEQGRIFDSLEQRLRDAFERGWRTAWGLLPRYIERHVRSIPRTDNATRAILEQAAEALACMGESETTTAARVDASRQVKASAAPRPAGGGILPSAMSHGALRR